MTFRATAEKPQLAVARVHAALLECLALQHPTMPRTLPERVGLHVYKADGCLFRWFLDAGAAVYLAEVSHRDANRDFEIFIVPHLDGAMRAGWRRRWQELRDPPEVWATVAAELDLEEPTATASDPDFAVLLAALAAGGTPSISYEDADARASLAADVRHLREIVDRQAQALRKAKLAAEAAAGRTESEQPSEATSQRWRLAELATWADLHADRICVLPRALAEAKKSSFENEDLVFDALELLADTYRSVKLSRLPREQLKARADELGLFLGGSVEPSQAGSWGEAYFVNHAGRRRFLSQHLGRGSSRDPRYSLRIYFFWDEDTQRACVGWLPSHLPNSLT